MDGTIRSTLLGTALVGIQVGMVDGTRPGEDIGGGTDQAGMEDGTTVGRGILTTDTTAVDGGPTAAGAGVVIAAPSVISAEACWQATMVRMADVTVHLRLVSTTDAAAMEPIAAPGASTTARIATTGRLEILVEVAASETARRRVPCVTANLGTATKPPTTAPSEVEIPAITEARAA